MCLFSMWKKTKTSLLHKVMPIYSELPQIFGVSSCELLDNLTCLRLKPATRTTLFGLNWSQLVDICNKWWEFTCRHSFVFRSHKSKRLEKKMCQTIIEYISGKNHQVSAHLDTCLLTVVVGDACGPCTPTLCNSRWLESPWTEEVKVE